MHQGEVPLQTRKTAWKAVQRLLNQWGVDTARRHLLFFVDNSDYEKWASEECFPNEKAILDRVKDLLLFHAALQGILTEHDICIWMNSQRQGLHFGGRSPLEAILRGNRETLKLIIAELSAEKSGN